MSSTAKIGKILVRHVDSQGDIEDRKVPIESFWQDSRCVIVFFRRFGCAFCRLYSKEFSEELKPILDRNNIKLIGVGFDAAHVKPFVQEGFFKGEIYVDPDMQAYHALNIGRYSWWQTLRTYLTYKPLEIMRRKTLKGVSGNLTEGDQFQSSGLLIVEQGGKPLLEYHQKDMLDMIQIDDILKVLNLKRE